MKEIPGSYYIPGTRADIGDLVEWTLPSRGLASMRIAKKDTGMNLATTGPTYTQPVHLENI